MISKIFRTLSAAVVLMAGALTVQGTAQAAPTLEGKKVTLIIPFKEGGGSTVYVRFLETLFKKHLPGNPTMIVRNIGGGGSVKGLNYFVRKAKPDGTMVSNTGASTLIKFTLGNKAVKYDLKKLIPVLSSPLGVIVYADKKTGLSADNIKQIKGMNLTYGDRSPTAGGMALILSYELLGAKIKYIFGLGSGKRRQAFQRSETNLNFDSMPSYVKHVLPLIKEGKAVALYTMGYLDESGKIVRDPMLPDLPTFFEVYEKVHGKPLTGVEARVMKALIAGRVMAAKMMLLPEKTPKDIVAMYDAAVKKIIADPEFTGPKGLAVMGPYPQSIGKNARAVLKEASDMDPEATKWLKNWLNKRFDVKS
jgi:tripartite-type tricarboxylate transporter receptor subunit TctC